ncbi:MAG TPA: tRNA lysidine(34) synthetase TilS [Stenotrophobium sp.]|jgi:tRNA(Ile)-lysidine synthase|nr:tRNA lysidine(34) synthetase TilS [Stenotrophobium sp.]
MSEFFTLPELPHLPAQARVWLAYSGGLDSSALLHALASQRLPGLRAVHVHHGLQPQADEWVQHCQAQCATLGVALEVLRVRVDDTHAAGPEAAAREARYDALRSVMRAGDLLATAHHQDDQAETVLLRLLRGTGVHGLSAMRPLQAFAPGQLWRPLLEVTRAQLFRYAQWHRLGWIEDPHNQSPRYARSWLRQELMPRLGQRWPAAAAQLAQAASHCADAADLLDERARADLLDAALPDSDGYALKIPVLQELTPARRRNLLRYWLRRCGWPVPSAQMLARLQAEVLDARADAQPLLNCGAYEFRRYRERLHVMAPLAQAPVGWSCEWNGEGDCVLPADCGVLQSRAAAPWPRPLTVRLARGGERIRLTRTAHHRTLKNLLQEAAVPPWLRPRLPLLYAGEQLLCVACRWWAAEAAGGLRNIVWRHALPGWNNDHEEQEP